jgi:hypothetical protein
VVGGNGVAQVLHHHRLAALGRGHDQRARVAKTDWAYIYKKGTKNVVSQQVPTIGVS